jgi:squalene synthase HpnC
MNKTALKYCKKIALNHYENFFITTFFFPKHLRQHIYNIYTYCRLGDDIVDEIPNKKIAKIELNKFRKDLDLCYSEKEPKHLCFKAIKTTIQTFNIPHQVLYNLTIAFEQDLNKNRYYSKKEMLDYCIYSANPVGELFLYVYGDHNEENKLLSNNICTALQLLNFLQDISIDLNKNRIYIPLNDFNKVNYTEQDLFSREYNENYISVIKKYVDLTETLFLKGMPLHKKVNKKFKKDILFFCLSGIKLLNKIRNNNYNTIIKRPKLSKLDFLSLYL